MLLSYLKTRILLLIATVFSLVIGHIRPLAAKGWDPGREAFLILLVVAIECVVVVARHLPARATARCMRDGTIGVLSAASLVWGDIIELRQGDVIPADCRIVQVTSPVTVDGVGKDAAPVRLEARPDEKTCVCFAGSSVSRGSFLGVVCGVGTPCETVAIRNEPRSQLFRSPSGFGVIATIVIIVGFIVVAVRRPNLHRLRLVMLAAAAVPEGFWALAVATESMATLARTTVICTNRRPVQAFSVVAGGVVQSYDIDARIPDSDEHQAFPLCLAKIAALSGHPAPDIASTGPDAKSAVHGPAQEVLMRCKYYLDDGTGLVTDLRAAIRNRIWDSMSSSFWLGLAFVGDGDWVWIGAVALVEGSNLQVVICTADHLDDDEACTGPEWDVMTDLQRRETARHASGLAHADPSHVSQFVDVMASQGEVVSIGALKTTAAAVHRAKAECSVGGESIGRIATTSVAAAVVCLRCPGVLQPAQLLLARLIVLAMPIPFDGNCFDWYRSLITGIWTGGAASLHANEASAMAIIAICGMVTACIRQAFWCPASWRLVGAIAAMVGYVAAMQFPVLTAIFGLKPMPLRDWIIVIRATLPAIGVTVIFQNRAGQPLTQRPHRK